MIDGDKPDIEDCSADVGCEDKSDTESNDEDDGNNAKLKIKLKNFLYL